MRAPSSVPSTGPPVPPEGAIRAFSEVVVPDPCTAERDLIAVIGMACRLPGAASPDSFWQLLSGGRDAVTRTPDGRAGGFPEQSDHFDAGFFGISPREAAAMDP